MLEPACKRESRQDICNHVVLPLLIFDLEAVLGEPEDPAFDSRSHGKVAAEQFPQRGMISSQNKLFAEQ